MLQSTLPNLRFSVRGGGFTRLRYVEDGGSTTNRLLAF